jgi:hypothetical protein
MTTTEDRLRDTFAAVAELVTDNPRQAWHAVRGDRVAAGRAHTTRPRWRRALPVAIAAAAAAVIAATVLITQAARSHSSAPAGPGTTATAPYFIANVKDGGINEATVRDAATGRITATVRPPAGVFTWTALAATGDPHTFYLATTTEQHHIYRLRVDGGGRISSLAEVAKVQAGGFDLTSLAAAPDARRVAFPVADPRFFGKGAYGPAEIDVLDVTTKRREAFRTTTGGQVVGLSWDASGRYVLYQLGGSTGRDGMWVLDTHAGHDLLAASRRVLPEADNTFVGEFVSPVLSADARHVYVIAAQQNAGGDRVTRVVELEVATGRQTRVLFEQPFVDRGNTQWAFTLLARDPGGRTLLALDANGHGRRIDVATGRTSTFPFLRGANPNAVAW